MRHNLDIIICYYREVVAGWFLEAAMFVAPTQMKLHIARGLHKEMRAYAESLKEKL